MKNKGYVQKFAIWGREKRFAIWGREIFNEKVQNLKGSSIFCYYGSIPGPTLG
jgi:hypothetical protein